MFHRSLFLFLFICSFSSGLLAQWTVYSTSNSGLPDNDVESIAIDASGNKWIGTITGGLTEFDGTNWSSYNTSNSGIPDDHVPSITVGAGGDKWLGTDQGLTRFDGNSWTVYDTITGKGGVAIDASGNKWVGGNKLGKYDGSWTIYKESNSGLPHNDVNAIAIDGSGRKWIGTEQGGLAVFDGSWTVHDVSNSGMPNDTVKDVMVDSVGNKWIATYRGGLAKYDGSTWTVFNASNSGIPGDMVNVLAAHQGKIWVGTSGDGLASYDGNGWNVYTSSNSDLPTDYVRALTIDSSGTKWIGTNGPFGGVSKLEGDPTGLSGRTSVDKLQVELRPVPTQGPVRLEFKGSVQEARIIVRDIEGRVLRTESVSERSTFRAHVEGEPGLYFIEVRGSEFGRMVKKVVKQ